MTRLTDRQIDGVLQATGTAEDIARQCDVSTSSVYIIKRLMTDRARGRAAALRAAGILFLTWAPPTPKRTLEPEKVAAIRASDEPSPVVAKQHGISATMVRMIRTGRAYR